MDESYDISITGVSYDLVAHNLQDSIKFKGEEKARGRGKTWYFSGLNKSEADALTISLTDAAANINYISTSDNRAMEAHILRKDAEKVRSAIWEQRRATAQGEIGPLCLQVGVALEAAISWMQSEDDDDGEEVWEELLIPALIAYRKAQESGLLSEWSDQ